MDKIKDMSSLSAIAAAGLGIMTLIPDTFSAFGLNANEWQVVACIGSFGCAIAAAVLKRGSPS